jgi:hypothetical protein
MEPTHALALLYVAAGAAALVPAVRQVRRGAPPPSRPTRTVLPAGEPSDQLRALHDHYIEQVNMAVAEGREDLVRQLCDAYTDEALLMLTSASR